MFDQMKKFEEYRHGRKGPLVWSFTAGDNPFRGDSKAVIGIGRRFSNILNGQHLHIDDHTIKKTFSATRDVEARIRRLIRHDGMPDYILATINSNFDFTPFF